jgi:hypothetical protein
MALAQGRRNGAVVVLAIVIASAAAGAGLGVRHERAARSQRAFFALLADAPVAHRSPATVSAARAFVERYPDSRWVGEALRIVAMNAWDERRYADAEAVWRRFEESFDDPALPGVAYAELSRGMCDERLGMSKDAARHFRAAIDVIRARRDGIQGWIATSAAQRLATIEQQEGMLATAEDWKRKAQAFSDAYPIESRGEDHD